MHCRSSITRRYHSSNIYPILVFTLLLMALSRIWAAFIIVSILAAVVQCVFVKNNSDLFNRMVTGKSGDTSQTKALDSAIMPAPVLESLQRGKAYNTGNTTS